MSAGKIDVRALKAGDAADAFFSGAVPQDEPVTKPYYYRPIWSSPTTTF